MVVSYKGSILCAREEVKEIIVKCKIAAGNPSKVKTTTSIHC
jgi:hypothetical protein